LTANSIKRKAVLLHSSVFKRISEHYFFHSRAETRGNQPEIRSRRPLSHGLTTPLILRSKSLSYSVMGFWFIFIIRILLFLRV